MAQKYFVEISVQLDETSERVEGLRPLNDNTPRLRQEICSILGIGEQDLHPARPVMRDPSRAEKDHYLGSGRDVYTLFIDADKALEVASGCGCAGGKKQEKVAFEVVFLDEERVHPWPKAQPTPPRPR